MALSPHQISGGDHHPSSPLASDSQPAPLSPGSNKLFLAQATLMLLLGGALASVFLAGGPKQGGIGLFLAVSGLAMISLPTLRATSWWYWLMGLLVLGAAASSFLPKELLPTPAWRIELEALHHLKLPGTITCDFLNSLFWVTLLGFSILIALYILGLTVDPRALSNLALAACLGCAAYAVVAWVAWQTKWHYPFFTQDPWLQPAFGFFPNRNHTAGFLLSGAIVSLGLIYRGMNGGRIVHAFIAACCFAILGAALFFFSLSRGGLIFLVAGVVIWIAGLGRYRSRWLLAGSAALGLVFLTLFLSSGGGLLERMQGKEPKPSDLASARTVSPSTSPITSGGSQTVEPASGIHSKLSSDARLAIWIDTISMIKGLPLTGSGLGTYALVYPFYSEKSFSEMTAIHGESDWLTLCAEGGIPAMLLVLGSVVMLAAGIPRLAARSGREWPVRWAFLSAFFAEVLHGFVDVPLHKPELGWWILLLGGIGFTPSPASCILQPMHLLVQRIFFVLGGVAMLVIGVLMIRAQWGGTEGMPPYALNTIGARISGTFDMRNPAAAQRAIVDARDAIARYPVAHPLYAQLAWMLLHSDDGKNIPEAEELFEVQQNLSPKEPQIPFDQGKAIAPYDPMMAATYWNEALKRRLALDASPKVPIARTVALYHSMISEGGVRVELMDRIPALAADDIALRMTWLNAPACPLYMIADAASDATFMGHLSAKEQGRLIELWWQRGDRKEVGVFLDSHPQYDRATVAIRATRLASSAQGEQACKLLIDTFSIPNPTPAEAPPASSLRSADRDIPDEPLAAAQYYMERGNEAASLRLLGEAMQGSTRTEAMRLRAVMEMRAGNWTAALGDLLGYLHMRGEL
ncbi:MAG: O-antigen ligase family protein [Verrucomicrobiota bacterium]